MGGEKRKDNISSPCLLSSGILGSFFSSGNNEAPFFVFSLKLALFSLACSLEKIKKKKVRLYNQLEATPILLIDVVYICPAL